MEGGEDHDFGRVSEDGGGILDDWANKLHKKRPIISKDNSIGKKQNKFLKLIVMAFTGLVIGFVAGHNFRGQPFFMISTNLVPHQNDWYIDAKNSTGQQQPNKSQKVPSNRSGIESLPPDIIASKSDLYLRRLWGNPSEDLTSKPTYLVAFTVGVAQKNNIDLAVKKFSDNFTVLLFHYDGQATDEWNAFEWSKKAIHVSVEKQTKWWYAKRFLHPDIVASYDYIFLWDEDLGVEQFDAEEYIKLVRKHGLEISQPGVESEYGWVWNITKRISGQEVHKEMDPKHKPWWCREYKPPCAGFVEIMAPVFSRNAWQCVWHMIQNDLVHGWGLDKAFGRCVEPPHEKMGIVDAQWIVHQHIPSLRNQGEERVGQPQGEAVHDRCVREEEMFVQRLEQADRSKRNKLATSINVH